MPWGLSTVVEQLGFHFQGERPWVRNSKLLYKHFDTCASKTSTIWGRKRVFSESWFHIHVIGSVGVCQIDWEVEDIRYLEDGDLVLISFKWGAVKHQEWNSSVYGETTWQILMLKVLCLWSLNALAWADLSRNHSCISGDVSSSLG